MAKPIVFSGIQPTGDMHIGNYLGAVRNWVNLQNSGDYDCYFSIVDYHSLTGNLTAGERKDRTVRLAMELLAAGIDPDKCTFFIQSEVPEHTELGWIFQTLTPMAELERMTQYKDKSTRQVKNINAGLFAYPALQAADILLYHSNLIPVGEDQVQHVELTRDTARWFNNRYGEYFAEPKPLLTNIPRVKSLLEPTSKMSKSHGEASYIAIADEPDVIAKKLKKAVTASEGGSGSLGVTNLLMLLNEFGATDLHDQYALAEKDSSIRYGDLKSDLARVIGDHFAEFRERRKALEADHDAIAEQLFAGSRKARERAKATMQDVRSLIGLR